MFWCGMLNHQRRDDEFSHEPQNLERETNGGQRHGSGLVRDIDHQLRRDL